MADVYQFSVCSDDLLKKCIEAGKQPGKEWMELFKPEAKENNSPTLSVKPPNESVADSEPSEEIQDRIEDTTRLNLKLEKLKDVKKILEKTPSNKLNSLMAFSEYEELLPDLAHNLPINLIEKICEEILESGIGTENIVKHFFPALFKREPSYDSLNLLVKGYKMYPETVLSVIQAIFVNIDVPNKHIEEFFIAVDREKTKEKAHIQFLQSIAMIGLPPEVFQHRLTTIYSLYIKSKESLKINNFVFNGLLQTAQVCQEDKNYGRFLITFLRQELSEVNSPISRQSLELLVDLHKTEFKKVCQKLLINYG